MPTTSKELPSEIGTRRSFLKGAALAAGATAVGGLSARIVAAAPTKADESKPVSTRSGGCPPNIRQAFQGPCPSISTPFTSKGDMDFDALHKMLDFVIDAKAKMVILTMGDSLFTILTDEDVANLTNAVCRHVNKRALVVAATQPWWTGKTVDFAAHSAEVGADLLMVTPPDWAASCTVESLVAHYRAASEKIPVMVVDNPLRDRPLSFNLELIKRLRDEVPGVIALKDDLGAELGRRIALLTHDRWALFASGKELHMNIYPYGVDGWMSTYMSFRPEISWRYKAAIEARDLEAARAILRDYELPLLEFLDTFPGGFDAGMHGILEIYGLAKRYRRPPYYSLNDAEMRKLSEFLKKKGLL
jgi:4-hydroxy-tetrahydrodipicolinate synthase